MAHIEALKRSWFSDFVIRQSGPFTSSFFQLNKDHSPIVNFIVRSIHIWDEFSSPQQLIVADELFLINRFHQPITGLSAFFNNYNVPISRTLPQCSFSREILLNSQSATTVSSPIVKSQLHSLFNIDCTTTEAIFSLSIDSQDHNNLYSLIIWLPLVHSLETLSIDDQDFRVEGVDCVREKVSGKRLTINSFSRSSNFDTPNLFRTLPIKVDIKLTFSSIMADKVFLKTTTMFISTDTIEDLPESKICLHDHVLDQYHLTVTQHDFKRNIFNNGTVDMISSGCELDLNSSANVYFVGSQPNSLPKVNGG
ncbi:hypothetical protein GEMRC1_003481 [Eukaryota sp. GEM-RC1]